MLTKALSEKNKFNLLKKLRSSAATLKYLLFAFAVALAAAGISYMQHWLSPDFPMYLLLLATVILIGAGISFFEITNIKKAIAISKKVVVTGPLEKKIQHSDEYSTEYEFVINGISYDVKSKHFEAFQEGELIQIELSSPGNELLKVKHLSHPTLS